MQIFDFLIYQGKQNRIYIYISMMTKIYLSTLSNRFTIINIFKWKSLNNPLDEMMIR